MFNVGCRKFFFLIKKIHLSKSDNFTGLDSCGIQQKWVLPKKASITYNQGGN